MVGYRLGFLMDYEELSQLRRALMAMDDSAKAALKACRFHATEDTKVRALYTYFFLGKTQSQVASFFWIHQTLLGKWIKKLFTQQLDNPDDGEGSSRSLLTSEDGDFIEGILSRHPLLFLREIKRIVLSQLNKNVSVSTIHRFLVQKRGWTRKRCQVIVRKAKAELIHSFSIMFRRNFGVVMQEQLVFIDELSFRVEHLQRRYGRSPKGQPVSEERPQFRERQLSFVVAISVHGFLACSLRKGHYNRIAFTDFLMNLLEGGVLGVAGTARSIIVMDGCRIHRHRRIQEGLRLAGVHSLILPPYCPEMNPIEAFFGQWRKRVRDVCYTNLEETSLSVIKRILETEMRMDCSRLFDHAGWKHGKVYKSPYLTEPHLRKFVE
ncbi:hypothetical protein GEMRC1_010002 [Eukaryota sp. GEM-RC1]